MSSSSKGILGRLGFVKTPGAAVPHRKNTKDMETVEMPVPATVTILMSQHIVHHVHPQSKLVSKCMLEP